MKYIDYLKKLGIDLDDEEKNEKFRNFILVQLNEFDHWVSGVMEKAITTRFFKENCIYSSTFYMSDIISTFEAEKDFNKVLVYYSSFLNILKWCCDSLAYNTDSRVYDRTVSELENTIENNNLNYKIVKDSNNIYLLPIEIKEMTEKLIIEPLEWLDNYPRIREQAINAMQTYYNPKNETVSEIVDKFRKLLEQFMQTYFNSKAALKSLIGNYGNKLKEAGVSTEIASEFEKILNLYDMYNNNHAKHHKDAADYDVEYIMYETFNIIRLLLQIQ